MDINEGSRIHNVRLKHFLGVLFDYAKLDASQIEDFIKKAKDRESQGLLYKYESKLDERLNELARELT